MFDVEEVEGSSGTMVPAFAKAFAAVKRGGLRVAVTTSHSAPYQCDTPEDAVAFVKAWTADANIDILSPQLYSSGSESSPEYAETSSLARPRGAPGTYTRGLTQPSHRPLSTLP